MLGIEPKWKGEHGLPSYNAMRELCGLPKFYSFIELRPKLANALLSDRLATLYESVDELLMIACGTRAQVMSTGAQTVHKCSRTEAQLRNKLVMLYRLVDIFCWSIYKHISQAPLNQGDQVVPIAQQGLQQGPDQLVPANNPPLAQPNVNPQPINAPMPGQQQVPVFAHQQMPAQQVPQVNAPNALGPIHPLQPVPNMFHGAPAFGPPGFANPDGTTTTAAILGSVSMMGELIPPFVLKVEGVHLTPNQPTRDGYLPLCEVALTNQEGTTFDMLGWRSSAHLLNQLVVGNTYRFGNFFTSPPRGFVSQIWFRMMARSSSTIQEWNPQDPNAFAPVQYGMPQHYNYNYNGLQGPNQQHMHPHHHHNYNAYPGPYPVAPQQQHHVHQAMPPLQNLAINNGQQPGHMYIAPQQPHYPQYMYPPQNQVNNPQNQVNNNNNGQIGANPPVQPQQPHVPPQPHNNGQIGGNQPHHHQQQHLPPQPNNINGQQIGGNPPVMVHHVPPHPNNINGQQIGANPPIVQPNHQQVVQQQAPIANHAQIGANPPVIVQPIHQHVVQHQAPNANHAQIGGNPPVVHPQQQHVLPQQHVAPQPHNNNNGQIGGNAAMLVQPQPPANNVQQQGDANAIGDVLAQLVNDVAEEGHQQNDVGGGGGHN